jgi:hypothetical protein
MGCRANAYIKWRDFVIPEDWIELLDNFLVHRLDIQDYEKNILIDFYNNSFKNF